MSNTENQIAELKQQLKEKLAELAEQKPQVDPFRELDRYLLGDRNRYKQLLHAIPAPVVVYDSKGCALFINQAFLDVYGFTREDLLGHRIDFVPPEEIEPTQEGWQRTLAGEKVHFETKRYTKDGSIRNIEIYTAIIQDEDQNHLASVVIHKDITQNKLAENERLEREKFKAAIQTAGAVCHEMSQPLQVIQGNTELLQAQGLDRDPKAGHRLNILLEQTRRLKDIIARLQEITSFTTKQYMSNTSILDIDQASCGKAED